MLYFLHKTEPDMVRMMVVISIILSYEISILWRLGGEQVPGDSAEFRYRTGTCTFRDQLSGTSARLSGTRQKSIRYRTGT